MKRTIFRISLVMLLGVVTSVAVAWGFSIRRSHVLTIDVRTFQVDGGERGYWRFNASRMLGCEAIYGVGFGAGQEPKNDVPWWAAADYSPDALASAMPGVLENRGEIAVGWPLLAMHTLSIADNGNPTWTTAWAVSTSTNQPYVLPYHPIWPGLLANTLVFGALWWALLFTPSILIRWRRRHVAARRGLCQQCGYDMKGNESGACPECGKER